MSGLGLLQEITSTLPFLLIVTKPPTTYLFHYFTIHLMSPEFRFWNIRIMSRGVGERHIGKQVQVLIKVKKSTSK